MVSAIEVGNRHRREMFAPQLRKRASTQAVGRAIAG